MGLLSKIIESQSTEFKNSNKEATDLFFSEIKSLEIEFEYSKKIFNLLCLHLKIKKGALLILDKTNNSFSPGIILNLDMTTSRHFRIESTFFDEHVSNFNKITFKENLFLKGLKQFFSIREYSALRSLMVVPFYLFGELNAILVIIDPNEKIVTTARGISLGSEKITKKLLKSRTPFNIESNNVPDPEREDPYKILENFISSSLYGENRALLIISLNVKSLLTTLNELLPDTDPFEIYKDVIHAIIKLISNSGVLVRLSADKHLIYYRLRTGTTPNLITHQINLAIATFFSIKNILPKITERFDLFKSPISKSVQSLLKDFL